MTPERVSRGRPPADRLDRRLPRRRSPTGPSWPAPRPARSRRSCPPRPPEQPEAFEHVFRDLERIILPGLSHWQHPSFFGYFPSNASLASVLGDYLSTGLGVLGLSWQSSPALTELEEVVTDWVRQMVGLSDAWSGVIQDTASTSTLVALLCARERTTDFGMSRGGLQARAAAAGRLHVEPGPQLGRQGGAARRLRPRERAARGPRRGVRHAPRRARRRHRGGTSPRASGPAPSSPRPARRPPPPSIPLAAIARRGRGRTASGCTSTPPWRARR